MGFLLSIIAQILYFIVGFINTPIVIYKLRKKRGFIRSFSDYQYQTAYDTDVFGNYKYRATWNTLLSKGGYKFGKKGETISSACGKKQLERSLSIGGWVLVIVLYVIDVRYWLKGGHCINSINK